MPGYTQKVTMAVEKTIQGQWGATGQTTEYAIYAAKVLNADRANDQIFLLSAGLSAQPISIAPLGVNAPAMLVFLCTDQPVDIRTNAASDTNFLSSVQLWCLAGYVSNVFLTTGSQVTTVMLKAAGGSAAVLAVTFPLP